MCVHGWEGCGRKVFILFGCERAIKVKFFRAVLTSVGENEKYSYFYETRKKILKKFRDSASRWTDYNFCKWKSEIVKSTKPTWETNSRKCSDLTCLGTNSSQHTNQFCSFALDFFSTFYEEEKEIIEIIILSYSGKHTHRLDVWSSSFIFTNCYVVHKN